MGLPERDKELLQTVGTALAEATARAGRHLACRPGCDHCCHGAFAISMLDAERLRRAFQAADFLTAKTIEVRARAWIAEYGAEFPGDPETGLLDESAEGQARFEEFANDARCPLLNKRGCCELYEARPMTCRVFGPPVEMEGGGLACCELCFTKASEEQIAACRMPLPHTLEAELEAEAGTGQTVVAFALMR
jgi:Fe-S-cluster containining protein